jgi:hypothetical protein
MLLLPARKLVPVLNLALTLLTIHSTSTTSPILSPVAPILDGLADHDLPQDLGRELLALFGTIDEGTWEVDLPRIVTEVGKGLLEDLRGESEGSVAFMHRWRETVGETWAETCDFKLLEVCLLCVNISKIRRLDSFQSSGGELMIRASTS